MSQAAVSHDLILGRYRPIRPLGSGGMGHVWLARDERTGLDVALKIVAREGKAGHRAEREARAAAALRHQRCQRIRSLARDPSHVYITYEYVPGRTLREAMRSGELDDRAMIEVAAQVCDALAHAHGRGIVHRDVKPSNVLLAETGEIDIRLLDFGLAQMAEFDTLTAFGDVPGTLAYISPERLGGAVATPAADVWAVGVLLWEGLAGRHPFWHGHGELNETTRRIEQGAPPLEALRPDLPAGIVQTIAAALVLNPERRPSAGRLAADLRSLPGRRRRTKGSRPASTPIDRRAMLVERVLPAAVAGLATGWVTSALPFYPPGWSLGLGALAAAATMVGPRLGLVTALAALVFPLGNISTGLATLYVILAAAWVGLTWRDARSGLLLVAGPLLAPLAALGLIPLAAQCARGAPRRALQAAAAVLLAGLVAGVRHVRLPFDLSKPPLGLGIAGSTHPTAVAHALLGQLDAHPVLLAEALIIAVAAVALPSVRGRGPWAAAGYGAVLLAATALTAPAAAVLPLIVAAWVSAAALTLDSRP